ncbi:MAG TPA: MBL fold metallo-hydrolase [Flavisolibacter sp.]|jgi:L-ascorbate metabolism protein UlaG (beta-lactamase superfamily)|nr:MBL fold metallo-hydrolase [Flavisolibacter sp.]
MNRKQIILSSLYLGFTPLFKNATIMQNTNETITVRLIRNATVTIQYKNQLLLIDPLFSRKSSLDPIPWTNEVRNPTVDLPFGENELKKLVESTTVVLVTHLHPDHWDTEAQKRLPKNSFLICQEEDKEKLAAQGFTNLYADQSVLAGDGIKITRVPARHGRGEIAERMAPVSGYIIQFPKKTIYLTGDTVWYEDVEKVISDFHPDLVIANGGAAQFQFGEPITMGADDVLNVARSIDAGAKVMVVHMEAINHCYLTRAALKGKLSEAGLSDKCIILSDGESVSLI